MTTLSRSLAIGLLLTFCWTALSPPGLAQGSTTQTPPQPSSTPTEKKKKVWTEEDLRKLHGGVSVVGEASAPDAKAAPGTAKQKKQAASNGILPAADETEAPPERPACKSRSWAAAVDAVLVPQGVNLGRDFWLLRSFGGDICTTEWGDSAALSNRVAGDYTLDDGSKVRIQVVFSRSFDDAIGNQQYSGVMNIVVYKGHPYVTTGYTGTKWMIGETVTGYELKTLTMTDPYEDRIVRFDKAKDNIQDFQSILRFVVKRP